MKKVNIIKAYFLISSCLSTLIGAMMKIEHKPGYSSALFIGAIHMIGFIYFFSKKELKQNIN